MDGISLKRKEIIEKWFNRSDVCLRQIYSKNIVEGKLVWNDEAEADIKAIALSYLANYVSIVDPSLKPALLQIVSRLADLEIAENSMNNEEKPSLKLVD